MNTNLFFNQTHYNRTKGSLILPLSGPTAFPNSQVALSFLSMNNEWVNISSDYGNNVIILKFPIFTGSSYVMTDFVLTLDAGFYSFDDLNNAIGLFCLNNGLYLVDGSGNTVLFVKLRINPTVYACEVSSYYIPTAAQLVTLGWSNPASFVLSTGTNMVAPRVTISAGLATLTGIAAATYPSSVLVDTSTNLISEAASLYRGTNAPQINNVTSINIRMAEAFITSSIVQPYNTLCQVPISASYGAVSKYEPTVPLYAPITNRSYTQIEIEFWDQTGRRLYPRDSDISATLSIRPLK